jgi:hypothetical protein
MGDDEDVGPTGGIATFCCGCLLWWPLAIFLTGWNEQTAVCREWAIDQALSESHKLSCDSRSKSLAGSAVAAGELGFVSCPVNTSTWKHFTSKSFAGLDQIPEGDVFGAAAADGAALSMYVTMWQCHERCARYECSRRLGEINETHSSGGEEKRQLLSRRGGGENGERRLKSKGSSKSCNQVCVDWEYSVDKTGVELSQTFHDPGRARDACGDSAGNLRFPNEPKLGTSYAHAASGEVHLNGGAWKLNSFQVGQLPIDTDVVLPNRFSTKTTANEGSPPYPLTEENTHQENNIIWTCNPGTTQAIGCMEISFQKAVPNTVTLLSSVSTKPGLFEEGGWSASGYWLCKDSSANAINRVCPASLGNTVSLQTAYTGAISCGEDVNTLEKLTDVLKSANTAKQWGLRALGFFLFFCSINMCFQPLKSLLGFITNSADSCADGIPCIGGCVDTLTDIFMGVVKAVLCVVAFCCAGACFLFIVAFMWVVMRPVTGSILMVVVCCCCIGASGLLYSQRDPDGKDKLRNRDYGPGSDEDDFLENAEDYDNE